MKQVYEKAWIQGFFTNCSLRATVATGMHTADIPKQMFFGRKKTRYRSPAVCSYKHTSDDQMEYVSDVVQGVKQFKKSTPSCTCESSSETSVLSSASTSPKGIWMWKFHQWWIFFNSQETILVLKYVNLIVSKLNGYFPFQCECVKLFKVWKQKMMSKNFFFNVKTVWFKMCA